MAFRVKNHLAAISERPKINLTNGGDREATDIKVMIGNRMLRFSLRELNGYPSGMVGIKEHQKEQGNLRVVDCTA